MSDSAASESVDLVSTEHITRAILILRDQRVLLDAELAALYGVTTKRLNEQVKRNTARFPADFLFRLSAVEVAMLNRSQIATGSRKHRDPRFPPFAFAEYGAIMASMILNSPHAVEMSVYVVRAFVQLREMSSSNRELARRFAQLETRLDKKLTEHDRAIGAILSAIRQLMQPTVVVPKRRPIGFTANVEEQS